MSSVLPTPPGVVALAIQVGWHAVMVTRPRKLKQVKACRRQLRDAIRHLEDTEAQDLLLLKQPIPADAVEYVRPMAVAALREGCKFCGQCAVNDLDPV